MDFRELRFYALRKSYAWFLKPFLFCLDAERVHRSFIGIGRFLGKQRLLGLVVEKIFSYNSGFLRQEFFGIEFRNPVGLSAGFDKDGEITRILENIGFGFIEVGGVTAKACKGNEGKRLKRLKEKESLWINLGLNNSGTRKVAERVLKSGNGVSVGFNVAKTNCKETVGLEEGIEDYVESLKILEEKKAGSYYTLNISCPNAFGGQPFSDPGRFKKLMGAIKKLEIEKPVFVKLSPDLEEKELKKILDISIRHNVKGFVCSNLTKKHGFGRGGLSGKSVRRKAEEMLDFVHSFLVERGKRNDYVLISVGGIFNADDVYDRIKSGADLVQLITGMVFEGPGIIGEINYYLEQRAREDGYSSLSELVNEHRNIYK